MGILCGCGKKQREMDYRRANISPKSNRSRSSKRVSMHSNETVMSNFNFRNSMMRMEKLQNDVNEHYDDKSYDDIDDMTDYSDHSESDHGDRESIDSIIHSVDDDDVTDGPMKLHRTEGIIYKMISSTDNFIDRNSFLASLIFQWSLFNFAVYVRNDHDADIIWACSTLMSCTGSLMTVILLSRKEMNYTSVLSTILVLVFSFFLLIGAGIFWVESKCDDSMSCGSLWFAQGVLMPSFCVIIIAVDLMKGYFENVRLRLLAYSGAMVVSGMTFCIAYFGQNQEKMRYSDKCTEAGFVILTGDAFYVFMVHGIFQYHESMPVNIFVSWWSVIALIFLLTSDEIDTGAFGMWYLIICYCLLVINVDVHYGGGKADIDEHDPEPIEMSEERQEKKLSILIEDAYAGARTSGSGKSRSGKSKRSLSPYSRGNQNYRSMEYSQLLAAPRKTRQSRLERLKNSATYMNSQLYSIADER